MKNPKKLLKKKRFVVSSVKKQIKNSKENKNKLVKPKIFNIIKVDKKKEENNQNNIEILIDDAPNCINTIDFINDDINTNINYDEEIKEKFVRLLLNPENEFFCFLCRKNITKSMQFYCDQCNGILFCINCFINKKHNTKHNYRIIDNLYRNLFNENFTIKDEYNMLYNLEIFGIDNWSSFAYRLDDNVIKKCKSHYNYFYYKSKDVHLPDEKDIIINKEKIIDGVKNKNVENENANISNNKSDDDIKAEMEIFNFIKKKQRLLENNNDFKNCNELINYDINRDEFIYDLEKQSLYLLSLLDFDKENGDNYEKFKNKNGNEKKFIKGKEYNEDIRNEDNNEQNLKLKYNILKDYNVMLNEKKEKINFIIKKNLFNLELQNKIESKLSYEDFEILVLIKPFLQYLKNSEFFNILEGLLIQKHLKTLLNKIKKIKPKSIKKKSKKSIKDTDLPEEFNDNQIFNIFFKEGTEIYDELKILEQKILMYLNYENKIENNNSDLFDECEKEFINEKPIAISTFYDIKLNVLSFFKTKNGNFSEFIKNLLEQKYDLVDDIKNDIFSFFIKNYGKDISSNKNDSKNNIIDNNINNNKDISTKNKDDELVNTEEDIKNDFFYKDNLDINNFYEDNFDKNKKFYFQNKEKEKLFKKYCINYKQNNNSYYNFINNINGKEFGYNIYDNNDKNDNDKANESNNIENNFDYIKNSNDTNKNINNNIYNSFNNINNNNLNDINNIYNSNDEIITSNNINNNYYDTLHYYNILNKKNTENLSNKNDNIITTHNTSDKIEDEITTNNNKTNYDYDLDLYQ